jgi:hypothetical protein
LGETFWWARQDAMVDLGQSRREDFGGKKTKGAKSRSGGNSSDEAISKRHEHPAPPGQGICNGKDDSPGGHDSGRRVVDFFWKAEQLGHFFSLGRP